MPLFRAPPEATVASRWAIPITIRISFVLFIAMVTVVVTATLFGLFLTQTGGYPAIFDKIGKQRMLSFRMVLLAIELEEDSLEHRSELRKVSEEFEEILFAQVRKAKKLSVVSPPVSGLDR